MSSTFKRLVVLTVIRCFDGHWATLIDVIWAIVHSLLCYMTEQLLGVRDFAECSRYPSTVLQCYL